LINNPRFLFGVVLAFQVKHLAFNKRLLSINKLNALNKNAVDEVEVVREAYLKSLDAGPFNLLENVLGGLLQNAKRVFEVVL
jgi:hypothetical protein